MMAMNEFWYAVPSIVLVSVANTLLKWRMDKMSHNLGFISKLCLVFTDPIIIVAVAATGLSIIWWLSIINQVQVSIVYPIIQAGVIAFTVLLSVIFLGETLDFLQLFGLVVVSLGICILSSATS